MKRPGELFVGVGVGSYTHLAALPRAVADVREVAEALGFAQAPPLVNPDDTEVRDFLGTFDGRLPGGGTLVTYWSGHGALRGDTLRLMTSNDDSRPKGMAVADVLLPLAESGANQLLFIFDVCHGGQAKDSMDLLSNLLAETPPEGKFPWFGILASCRGVEEARDGVFGDLLLRILRDGPRAETEILRDFRDREFSARYSHVTVDALHRALKTEWTSTSQLLDFRQEGTSGRVIPNPRYRPDAPAVVVEHLLQAARSGGTAESVSAFTGRIGQVNMVVSWVLSGEPGLSVITGPAGTGKSAILGHVVSLANADERPGLLVQPLAYGDPGQDSIAANLNVRSLTTQRVAGLLDGQLSRNTPGVRLLRLDDGDRNPEQLVGDLRAAVEGRGMSAPVVAIDGLDEAGAINAFDIATELLLPLSRFARVVVATRELPSPEKDGASLVNLLTKGQSSGTDVVDLGSPEVLAQGLEDLRSYVVRRLSDRDPRMAAQSVADLVAERARGSADLSFLLARLVCDQLTEHPLDTSGEGWESGVAASFEEAFAVDLARVPAPPHRPRTDGPGFARSVLKALTWSLGAGFPMDEWALVTGLAEPGGQPVTEDDLWWMLQRVGRYVLQDGESGQPVYRLAHASFATWLRPPFSPSHEAPFDPDALVVAEGLGERYARLLDDGVPPQAPAHLWRYFWGYSALAGPPGLDLLRGLAAAAPDLRADVASAALNVSSTFRQLFRRAEALPPTQEAVNIYRELADTNPAFRPDLAMSLNNLGIRFSEVGRRAEALPPTQEAVDIYRELADTNPAFRPDLAMSLNNLGNRLSEVGRRAEALPPTQEAVDIRRELADTNPAFRPDLASSLNNLGIRFSEVGRRAEALPPTQEAVDIRRELADTNPAFRPDLAMSLNNLGNRFSEVGRRAEALPPTQEAVDIYRELADTNPAFRPDLASSLNNLGVGFSEVGRRAEALPPTQEAVDIYRELADTNPAFRPDLASSLNNLGVGFSEVGRRAEALPPTQEAVDIRRELADTNPAFRPDLARSLNNLGIRFSEVGRRAEALPPTQEAVDIYRELADTNPAFRPDLASSLNNLGIRFSEVGRRAEALPPTQEAVDIRRELADTNPAFRPDLAMSLNNLGIRFSEVGRRAEALPPTQEAVDIRRELADTNPAFRPDLASSLNNLGIRFSEVGRRAEALPPTQEAVDIRRELADTNPAFRPDLAMSLNNLGIRFSEVGRRAEALPPTQEAVDIRRELADTNPAFRPDLASSLNNLGVGFSEVGRRAEALPPTQEAVDIYRELADTNPAFRPDLAMSLNNLGVGFSEVGRADEPWPPVLEAASPAIRAELLAHRAAQAPDGHAEAATWLHAALAEAPRDLGPALHHLARRHRGADQATFDGAWSAASATTELPNWLIVDPDLLSSAEDWVSAPTFDAEAEYLSAHPELLDKAADVAVVEAMALLPSEERQRLATLRDQARTTGVGTAYRPLRTRSLARHFVDADLDGKRTLLNQRRRDLVAVDFGEVLDGLHQGQPGPDTVIALALRALATRDEEVAALDALQDPDLLPALLHHAATQTDPAGLEPLALCALATATVATHMGVATFYLGVAHAIDGTGRDDALDLMRHARSFDVSQAPALIALLVDIVAVHPLARTLLPALTDPLPDPEASPMTERQPTDLVVVLPGITGSTLYRDGKPIWKPSAGAILHALFTLGGSLRSLALPTGIGDDHPGDGVEARSLIDDVHVIPGIWAPIKGYDVLVARIESLGYRRPTADTPGNLLPMPYDWRLSNRYTAAWMAPTIQRELERWRAQGGRYADAQVVFVCHSMGGLVARRYAAAHGSDHVRKIVTFGTPMRGSMDAVDQLVNGAPGKLGPLRGLVTDLSRSLPSLHQLLPSYACVVPDAGGELTHLDPGGIPHADAAMVADGLAFHAELEAAEATDPTFAAKVHAIVGTNQPTQSTVRFTGDGTEIYSTYGSDDFMGDSTVPLVGAVPKGVPMDANTLRHVPDNHGNLQRNAAALDELEGILTAKPVVIKGGLQVPLSVTVPELVTAGETLDVRVGVPLGNRPGLHATLRPADRPRAKATTRVLTLQDGIATASFEDLRPGAYVVDVTGSAPGSPVAPVSAVTLVWDSAAELP